MKTYKQAKLIASAMKQQNVTLAAEELEKTKLYSIKKEIK
jgi:hypothetical protein